MANNQQIQDPSTQGVGGLKGIKSIDALKQEGLLRDVPLINSIEDYKQVSNRALEKAAGMQPFRIQCYIIPPLFFMLSISS